MCFEKVSLHMVILLFLQMLKQRVLLVNSVYSVAIMATFPDTYKLHPSF